MVAIPIQIYRGQNNYLSLIRILMLMLFQCAFLMTYLILKRIHVNLRKCAFLNVKY